MRHLCITLALVLFVVACASGGGTGPGRVTSPFTSEHALIFDGGVDFIGQPEDLIGRWREIWWEELANRTVGSDLIAVVRVGQLRQAMNLDRQSSFLFVGTVSRVLHGSSSTREVTFSVSEAEPGYDSLEGNESRVLDREFVAFVKWANSPQGTEVVARWHLSPASDYVLEEVLASLSHRPRAEQHQQSESRGTQGASTDQ